VKQQRAGQWQIEIVLSVYRFVLYGNGQSSSVRTVPVVVGAHPNYLSGLVWTSGGFENPRKRLLSIVGVVGAGPGHGSIPKNRRLPVYSACLQSELGMIQISAVRLLASWPGLTAVRIDFKVFIYLFYQV